MDDDVRAVGLEAGELPALLKGHVRQVAGDAQHEVLRQDSPVHVGAIRPADALHDGGEGREGAAGAAPGGREGEGRVTAQGFLQDVGGHLLHCGQVAVVADGQHPRQADGAHLAGEAAAYVHVGAHDDLRGAAADVDHAGVPAAGCAKEG